MLTARLNSERSRLGKGTSVIRQVKTNGKAYDKCYLNVPSEGSLKWHTGSEISSPGQ